MGIFCYTMPILLLQCILLIYYDRRCSLMYLIRYLQTCKVAHCTMGVAGLRAECMASCSDCFKCMLSFNAALCTPPWFSGMFLWSRVSLPLHYTTDPKVHHVTERAMRHLDHELPLESV